MNVLLVGSSFSAAPMLFDLKARGAHVTVVGKYQDDPCHAYADHSIYIDYSDPEVLMDVCRNHAFDCLVPSCNDYAYVSAAQVAGKLGYAGFDLVETTQILHEKDRFRRFCETIDIPAPRIISEIDDEKGGLEAELTGPALVKPVDSFSGRGVQLVRDPHSMPTAIKRGLAQSRNKRVVIEEFVQGGLHSHSAFVADGEIVWHEFVDEYCDVYPYQVDRSSYPSLLHPSIREQVNQSIKKLVKALSLADGLLHTQFIASKEKSWIIECMRRCPGDLYGHHFLIASGLDYVHEYVAPFLGIAPKALIPTKPLRRVERRVVSVDERQPFFGLRIDTDARPSSFIPLKESGYELEAAPFDKAGILFLEGSDTEDPNTPFQGVTSGTIRLDGLIERYKTDTKRTSIKQRFLSRKQENDIKNYR